MDVNCITAKSVHDTHCFSDNEGLQILLFSATFPVHVQQIAEAMVPGAL